jgi:hypothetical protein
MASGSFKLIGNSKQPNAVLLAVQRSSSQGGGNSFSMYANPTSIPIRISGVASAFFA